MRSAVLSRIAIRVTALSANQVAAFPPAGSCRARPIKRSEPHPGHPFIHRSRFVSIQHKHSSRSRALRPFSFRSRDACHGQARLPHRQARRRAEAQGRRRQAEGGRHRSRPPALLRDDQGGDLGAQGEDRLERARHRQVHGGQARRVPAGQLQEDALHPAPRVRRQGQAREGQGLLQALRRCQEGHLPQAQGQARRLQGRAQAGEDRRQVEEGSRRQAQEERRRRWYQAQGAGEEEDRVDAQEVPRCQGQGQAQDRQVPRREEGPEGRCLDGSIDRSSDLGGV